MTQDNHIVNVAVVGATGNVGRTITAALLSTGRHAVTAITRQQQQQQQQQDPGDPPPGGSSSSNIDDDDGKWPAGLRAVRRVADYGGAGEADGASGGHDHLLVDALRGQHALVIALSGRAGPGAEPALIRAAAAAGVAWVLPSDFTPDTTDEALVARVPMFRPKVDNRNLIRSLGVSSYISVITGFWYEWLLAVPAAFGFDPDRRAVTLIDDGDTPICLSTWPQIGRAVAALLSLPVHRRPSGNETPASAPGVHLEDFRNGPAYVYSFVASQRDMLESARRVFPSSAAAGLPTETGQEETGGQLRGWTVAGAETAEARYAAGQAEIAAGAGKTHSGYAKVMCAPVFARRDGGGSGSGNEGVGDFSSGVGKPPSPLLLNASLGLPAEDRACFDRATRAALDRHTKLNTWAD